MNLEINYNNQLVASIETGSIILATQEKYLTDNISAEVKNIVLYDNTLVAKKPTNTSVVAEYTGSVITNGYKCPVGVSYTGLSSGTIDGIYTAVYTPDENCIWEDGTRAAITVTLTILLNIIHVGPKPTNPEPVNYDGNEHTNGYTCPTGVSMSADSLTKGTAGGNYIAKYTPLYGYAWDDNTQDTVNITLTILYVWLKWNINISYNDSIETKSFVEQTLLESSTSNAAWGKATSFSFDSTTGKYTLSGGQQFYGTSDSQLIAAKSHNTCASGLSASSNLVDKVYAPSQGGILLIETRLYGHRGIFDSFICDIHTATEIHSKGQTQYSNVSDIDINAYPTVEGGAEQNGYWYVKTW